MGASDALKLGADLAMTVLILSIMFMLAGIFVSVQYKVAADNNQQVMGAIDPLTQYENSVVYGDVVQHFIEDHQNDAFIRVTTSEVPEGVFGDALTQCTNVDSISYINPMRKFYCSVQRSADTTITSISFEQEGVILSAEDMRKTIQVYEQELNVR